MKIKTLVQHLANLTNLEMWTPYNVRCESRSITTQPGEIDDRESEVIAFVVNAGMNITANRPIVFSMITGSNFVKHSCVY